ncbi:hypothetical protein UFOVP1362_54 [uncultured Caudovirales phage]|uniref:Uncharacterized protein n=1 Tax=uncultured Caudovirales phage TaxID=2100421 RepID=A0A6J5S2W1_9CAUD|nr:hypothetical protein UFOVP1101_28 [uncultured Caudovirales phage]CAB4202069.1 hypothetical protein UFOVP1362_54 [uncultured Caudovirales phage]
MAVTPKVLIASQQLTNSNATYYTATNVTTFIDKMTVCNTSGSSVTLTIDLVTALGSAGVSKRIISARIIAAGDTYLCPEAVGHILAPGDTIQGLAGAVTSLTIRSSGREVSGL